MSPGERVRRTFGSAEPGTVIELDAHKDQLLVAFDSGEWRVQRAHQVKRLWTQKAGVVSS